MLINSVHAQFSSKYIEDELIIWLNPGVLADEFAKNISQDVRPKRLLSKRLNIWLFEFLDSTTQRSTKMNSLRLNEKVKHIQNNHIVTSRAVTPNDDYYAQQWAPSKIHLPDAWDEYTTGGTSSEGDDIVIAVIDEGFDLTHEDLNFWKNPNEIPNNGIDDDNNGYIDDYDGWNAYNNTGNIPNNSHGTHVAGIIGAIGNNDTGVSGVNWDVHILPVAGSSTTEATVVEAYSYILEMRTLYNETNGQFGAFVVATNSSFGVNQGNPDNFPIWCSLYDELGSVGILNCAATANENWNIDQVGDVPTTCSSEFLIAVTNTTSNDSKYSNAGYGVTHIDLGAPGTNIYSTLPSNNYGNYTGTSMATPQVAGVIALMYASMCQNMIQEYKSDPENFALLVRQHLFEGADNISSLNGLVAHGRLNALNAIEYALGIRTSAYINGPINVIGKVTFNIANFPSGATVTWSTSNSNLQLNSGQGTSAAEFESINYGSCIIYAALSIGCYSATLQYNVTADFDLSDVYIQGPDFVCGSTATLIMHNLPQPFTISWNGQSFLADSVYSVNTSYYSGNPGVAKVTARANYKGKIIDMEHSFSFNYPGTYYVEDTVMYNNGFYYDSYRDVAGVSVSYLYPASGITYEWSCNNNWTLVSGGTDYAMFEGPPTQSNIDVKVCFNNPCGQRTCLVRELYMPQEMLSLMISPNPATSETTVSIGTASEQTSSFSTSEEWSLEVYDTRQTLKTRVARIKGNSAKIQTNGWIEGVYLVRAVWKNKVLTSKLIVKR
jgi:subtilisin family serine protease